MKIEFRKEETDDGDELSREKLNPDVGGALLCGRLNLQREQEPKSQNKNEEHNSDLEKVQREKQGAQTRSKNSFLWQSKQDLNSEIQWSPSSLPHLIIGNENEFLAH
jgi:hypothetical protein